MNTAEISRTATIGRTAILGAAATLLISAALVPAVHAAPGDEAPSVVIKYDAARAATEQGALELYARLVYAARQVCPSDSTLDLMQLSMARRCQKEALSRAVNQSHERRLVEIAASRANRG